MKKLLHKIVKQISEYFNNNTSNSTEVYDPYKGIPDPANFFKDTLGMKDIDRDSKIPENLKKVLNEIENMGERLRKLGETDGPFQMRYKAIKVIAQNTAIRTSKYIETIFKGISESVENEIKVKKKEEERIKQDEKISKDYLEELKLSKYNNPKNYLLWEAVVFIIFGFALLAGDVVLSLSGTKEAFLLKDWEAWAMSIGITACTIYIKVYYDEHILPAIEKSVTMFKHENLKGIDNDESKNWLIGVWSFRFSIKTMVFIFTIIAIYLLGELRFEVMSKIIPELSQISYSRITFVCLSMLFPIIGGVCMAMAIKKFRYYGLLWKTKREVKELRLNLYKTQEQLSKCEQDLANCSTYISWTTNKEFIEGLSEFLFACYLHGYEYAFRKYNMKFEVLEKAKDIRRLFSGDKAQLNSEYPL